MMQFEKIKESIINNVLGPAEAGLFRTVGYQKQTEDAVDMKDEDRVVQVFYSAGQFPQNASSINGPYQHEMSFRVELSVAKAAEVDVATLTNPGSTDAQRAIAMQAFVESSDLADVAWDELFRIVYQILMNATNIDLGLDKGEVADRWVNQVKKDEPITDGEFAVITGSMVLTCSSKEPALGDTGTIGAKGIGVKIDIKDDDVEETAVETTTT